MRRDDTVFSLIHRVSEVKTFKIQVLYRQKSETRLHSINTDSSRLRIFSNLF